jgi:glycopeptide antibiotics resistance protein
MRTWAMEFSYAIQFFVLLTVVFVAPWVQLQYHRFGTFRGWPAVVSASIVLYATSLVAFTLFPLPDFTDEYCASRSVSDFVHLRPLNSLDDVAAYLDANGLAHTLTSGVFLQVFFNVVFFVPLGIFVAYRYRRGIGIALLASIGVSLLIETTQGTGIWGLAPCPYRLADVDDLITNTAGGLLGWVIGVGMRHVLPDPRPVRVDDLDPPTRRRRSLGVVLDVMVYLVPVSVIQLVWLRVTGETEIGDTEFFVIGSSVSLVLMVVIPAFRRDRAGPGDAAVRIALVRSGSDDITRAAAPWSLLVRWLIRWVPFAYLGIVYLAPVLIIELIVSLLRKDRRSFSDLVSRTTWITRDRAETGVDER